jgi:hypothetical protein
MQFERRKKEWWVEPELQRRKVRVPAALLRTDPTAEGAELPSLKRMTTGAFSPKRKWQPFNRLQGIDAGYMVPLFTLSAIGKRYGLSQTCQRHFRKNILPPPYDLVRRRSVNAHHWSKFTLLALDVVLGDLEDRGRLEFLSTYRDHVALVTIGTEYLHEYYDTLDREAAIKTTDKFGVEWF